MSITAGFASDKAWAADKETPFRAPTAMSMEHRQTNDKITIGVEPYESGDKVKVAFGKLDPYQYGILPVLVVIQNDTGQAIRLDKIRAEYVGPNRDRVEATPARDVRYLRGAQRPAVVTGPAGGVAGRLKKNPLEAPQIEVRALSAPMLNAGQSASGFLYFQTGIQKGSTIYITGLREASSGKEILFFEIPLE